MKAVIQRVNKARVINTQTGRAVGQIGAGLFILLGIAKNDSEEDAEKLADKIANLRIMADKNVKMNMSIRQTGMELLVVSQFTLLADTKKGNRPSFLQAMEPKRARLLYDYFIDKLKAQGIKVATGSFGDYMYISTDLDGPFTIVI